MRTLWGGCVESPPAPYDAQDTAPTIANLPAASATIAGSIGHLRISQ